MHAHRTLPRLIVLIVGAGVVLVGCGAEANSASPTPFASRPGIQIDPNWQNDAGTFTFTGTVDPQGAATDVVLEIGPGPSTLRQFSSRIDVAAGIIDRSPLTVSTRDIADIPEICVRFTATNSIGKSSTTPLCFPHDRPTFVPDQNPPVVQFTAPAFGFLKVVNSASFSVRWTEVDGGSGVDSRSLQRQAAPFTNGSCGTFADDGEPSVGPSPLAAEGLVDGMCYQWVLTLRDLAGDSGITMSGAIHVDLAAPG